MQKNTIDIPKKIALKIQDMQDSEDMGGEFCLSELISLASRILKLKDGKKILEAVCLKLEKMLKSGKANFYDYCLLAEAVKEKLGDEIWARKLLEEAEGLVDDSIGGCDQYGFEDEDSYYAIFARKILDILDDQEWAAEVISDVLCYFDNEEYTAPIDCAYLVACQMPGFVDLVWGKVLDECGDSPVRAIHIARAILEIDDRLYLNADAETKRQFKKDEKWHQQNLAWAKKFIEIFVDELEEGTVSYNKFDESDVEQVLKILNDKELSKRVKEAMEEI
mgnify:CR=1 FL=1